MVLIIAGFDPCGGAGLQADLKTVTLLGGTGLTIATALTVQNSKYVKDSFPLDKEILEKQFNILYEDFKIDGVKIGMLPNTEIIRLVERKIKEFSLKNIILDPVIKAKDGFLLNEAIETMLSCLFPLADLVTPNIDEVEYILGKRPSNVSQMKEASLELKKFGPKAILIKAGEFSLATDILYDGYNFYIWETTKRQNLPVHGTGCVLSSAIATFLAKGFSLLEAVNKAKEVITLAVDGALSLGKGNLLSNPFAYVEKQKAYYEVIEALNKGLKELQCVSDATKIMPEVRMNLVYALPYAREVAEVAGFPGRLTLINGKICAYASPAFGVSHHMASVVLKVMEFDNSFRAAMNIRYHPDIIERAKYLGYKVIKISREKEPLTIKEKEGMSLPWITQIAIKKLKSVPDFIYDEGDFGKEPMIRVLGRDPFDVIKKMLKCF